MPHRSLLLVVVALAAFASVGATDCEDVPAQSALLDVPLANDVPTVLALDVGVTDEPRWHPGTTGTITSLVVTANVRVAAPSTGGVPSFDATLRRLSGDDLVAELDPMPLEGLPQAVDGGVRAFLASREDGVRVLDTCATFWGCTERLEVVLSMTGADAR